MEFEAEPLADVKSGSITFSISWVEASDGDNEVRALVERDPEIRSILKDVRKQIDINAAREVGLEEKSLRPLKRGNSTNLSNDPSSASRVMDESQRTKTQEAKLSIAVRR